MAYRYEQSSIVIDGFENGIGNSPFSGLSDMRNAEIIQEEGEISVAFIAGAVTLPPVFNAVAYTAAASTDRLTVASVTGLYECCAIVLASNTATGLTNSIVYYVRNISGLTFQVSTGPATPVINITADGSGTLTTYQYGNQRGLTDNGAPVSYYNAPEIGGVLLMDSSNYAWLWQQGSDGDTPINTLLFLGNIGGIGATSDNQTGVAYWNGYVVIVQQPSIVDVLNWSTFISANSSAWNYVNVKFEEDIVPQLGFSGNTLNTTTIGIVMNSTDATMPEYLYKDRVFATGSSTTVTSGSISLSAGDTVISYVVTWNNTSISSATFNGSAMTSAGNSSGTSPFTRAYNVFKYQASSDETGTVVATYSGAATNRLVVSVVMRGITTSFQDLNVRNEATAQEEAYVDLIRDEPNQPVLFFCISQDDSIFTSVMSSGYVELQDNRISLVGHDWLYYSGEGHGASTTLKKNVPITVADNNTLYWGDGENIVASLNQNAGYIFTPTDSTSFTFSWEALDIPNNEIVQSLVMGNSTLFIGADSKNVYPWDTISPSFDTPINFPEPAIADFVATNNLVYAFGGNQGRIYLTNESSATLYREIPGAVTGEERPFFFFWDANVGNNELYFSFQSYTNAAPTTPLTTTGGVWAINSDTNALRMVQSTLNANAWVRMVNPVADGYQQSFLRPPGQGLLVGYSVGSNYYLDYSTSLPSTDYSTYFESEIIPVGTYFDKTTFENIQYKLSTPMVANEGIRVSQRSNITGSYTVIAEFTTAGLISDQASINWENVEWFQLKVEMKSVVSSPSYVRLREIRLR